MMNQLEKAKENWIRDIIQEVARHRKLNGLVWDDPVGVDLPDAVVPLLDRRELAYLKIQNIFVKKENQISEV